MKLLCNEEEFSCTKPELLNVKISLLLAKLNMVSSTLVSNGWFFSNDVPVDIKLVAFLLLSNISELSIGAKTKRFW